MNALMLIAIPLEGHHYLTDMIAGAGVAALSIAIVRAAARPRGMAAVRIDEDAGLFVV